MPVYILCLRRPNHRAAHIYSYPSYIKAETAYFILATDFLKQNRQDLADALFIKKCVEE